MTESDPLIPFFGNQPWVMGILNVTPDSFSDGGRWNSTDAAIAHGRELAALGAAIVDVGGESTRPGAERVPVAAEVERVVPVIRALAEEGVLCSVDTTRAVVAQAALDAGAALVNDVSGGLADPAMVSVVAAARAPWVLMHWRGHSDVMGDLAAYGDVVAEVRGELLQRVDDALAGGVEERSLILDPGLGFAKDADHNWQLLAHLDALVDVGLPVLVGASRKRFLGTLLGDGGVLRPAAERETATAVLSVIAAQAGAWGVRVHEPRPTLDALTVLSAVDRAARLDLDDGSGLVPPAPVFRASFADEGAGPVQAHWGHRHG
jgi:dihydropteroate synthase